MWLLREFIRGLTRSSGRSHGSQRCLSLVWRWCLGWQGGYRISTSHLWLAFLSSRVLTNNWFLSYCWPPGNRKKMDVRADYRQRQIHRREEKKKHFHTNNIFKAHFPSLNGACSDCANIMLLGGLLVARVNTSWKWAPLAHYSNSLIS